jgi:hypothetical protein
MESLTRNNYEIWFLDYLDGQLSNEQLDILLDFLEENPDLKAELRGVGAASLQSGSESLSQKELLMKSPEDIPGIAAMDQLCIARMENDLTEEEARQFDLRLTKEPTLEKEYSAFMLTRLNPADRVVYPYKSDLRKKTIQFSPWVITAISSAAILILALILWPNNHVNPTASIARVEQPQTHTLQPTTPNLQPATRNLQPATRNLQPSTRNLQPATRNLQSDSAPITPRESLPMEHLVRKYPLAGPRIPDPQRMKLLLASNYPAVLNTPVTAGEVLTIPQYALRLFRERILGEDRKQVRKTRFSLWEVAGAGVEKINDLAGTQMKLNREYDSKGDILAVSFNSRLIDIESPVKGQ